MRGEPGLATPPVPAGLDPGVPNVARIYDALLGGKDNYAADRRAAERLLAAVPGAAQAARDNRAFLRRAVRFLAREGISQFIDLGAGLPSAGAVHEIADTVRAGARVAYVDNDPIVVAHARALLADSPSVAVIEADIRYPRDLLTHPAIREVIDFTQPVAVLLVAVLHFIPDHDDPQGIVACIADRVAPGSYLAISHVTADHISAEAAAAASSAYDGASAPATARILDDIEAFFYRLELVPPGITDPAAWRGRRRSHPEQAALFWAGVGRVPGPRTPGTEAS
jgi:SAM-dependent methyltransferase